MSTLSARRPGLGRRLIALAAAAAAWCALALTAPVPPAAAAAVLNPTWSTSNSATSATGASYRFNFTTATTSPVSSVTMTVPAGTTGTLVVGSVRPAGLAGGTPSIAGTTLTYTLASAVTLAAGTAVSIQVRGLTNTSTAGSYTSSIATVSASSTVDTGTAGAVAFTVTTLSGPGWAVSSSTTGATGVTYTYTFTTPPALLTTFGSVTMTVPPGTSGTPALGTVTPGGLGGSITLSGTTLTYSATTLALGGGTVVTIPVNGLTNTATAGNYASEITTFGVLGGLQYSGVTPEVSISGLLRLTAPSSLAWSATLNGTNQSLLDTTAADQQFTVDDETNTGGGWHITAAALTFTSGTKTLADSGTLSLTGSATAATATTAPSVTCLVSCGPPGNTTTYPVAITTAAASPTPATVFSAPASSGLGPVLIGGSSAVSPVGWWISVPGSARAGAYTSTVTIAVVSGP